MPAQAAATGAMRHTRPGPQQARRLCLSAWDRGDRRRMPQAQAADRMRTGLADDQWPMPAGLQAALPGRHGWALSQLPADAGTTIPGVEPGSAAPTGPATASATGGTAAGSGQDAKAPAAITTCSTPDQKPAGAIRRVFHGAGGRNWLRHDRGSRNATQARIAMPAPSTSRLPRIRQSVQGERYEKRPPGKAAG